MAKKLVTPEYKIIYPLRVAKSKIAGKGAYAIENIPARKKLGDLGGVIITLREARRLVKDLGVINMVEFGNGHALNASLNPNDLRFINHSCGPNTYMRVTHNRVEFYTLRKIKKGEELTCDYGETHHDGKLPCRCGAPNCRKFI
ncbi:MAG: SET domain-containing protein-lysine N-methyltransferase [Gemmatimonadaceae bacterium]|nr:SET domain-containing protein-lysine N-methyltransferase [Chitinophagaceae bacterium]